jgi:hypothetical protein
MKSIYLTIILAIFSISLVQYSYAQNEYPITISPHGTSFLPSLFKSNGGAGIQFNQMDVIITYVNSDNELVNETINALGIVYDSEDNKIDEMSYKDGFTITTDGFMKFTNTIPNSFEDVTIDLYLTDLNSEVQLSNELRINFSASNPIVNY